jgi:hypothetical protein
MVSQVLACTVPIPPTNTQASHKAAGVLILLALCMTGLFFRCDGFALKKYLAILRDDDP